LTDVLLLLRRGAEGLRANIAAEAKSNSWPFVRGLGFGAALALVESAAAAPADEARCFRFLFPEVGADSAPESPSSCSLFFFLCERFDLGFEAESEPARALWPLLLLWE